MHHHAFDRRRCPATLCWSYAATFWKTSFCASTRHASLGATPTGGAQGSAGTTPDEDEVAALCQTKLANFATVVVFTRADLEAEGIDVIGTFRTPHVTLAAADIEALVTALTRCPHQVRANPYHGNTTTEEVR
jgi:hypothetical protein